MVDGGWLFMMGNNIADSTGIYSLEHLQGLIVANPEQWRPLVFTNGCFDLLHPGHVRYLQAAKALGKTLVVGLNSDRSIMAIKPAKPGQPQRPIVIESHRAEVLAALRAVDGVVIFDERTADNLIITLQPDIYVKGGDYSIDTLPEAHSVQAYGGKIQLIQVEIPTSTTAIIQKILNRG
jgi:D-glycero-beta-D-manno-heptose 1-phosphate adenylyltransferase